MQNSLRCLPINVSNFAGCHIGIPLRVKNERNIFRKRQQGDSFGIWAPLAQSRFADGKQVSEIRYTYIDYGKMGSMDPSTLENPTCPSLPGFQSCYSSP